MITKKEYHAPCVFSKPTIIGKPKDNKMKRNRKKWLAVIRHILTFLGGALVVNDIDSGLVNEAIGGVLTTVGAAWSIADKKDALNDRAE